MKNFLFKLKILYWFLCDASIEWKEAVWDADLDAPYCCSGESQIYPCACGGETVRELYTRVNK